MKNLLRVFLVSSLFLGGIASANHTINITKNTIIAFNIAEVNPHAALIFSDLTDSLAPTSLPENGPIVFGLGDISMNTEIAMEIIKKTENREKLEKPLKLSDAIIMTNYEMHRSGDDLAYLTIEVRKLDREGREIEKITPNIRVQLQRSDGDAQWEPIGWQSY